MENYISIKEAATTWQISERRVRALCMNGQIDGAVKVGKSWCVPKSAQKPSDKRSIKEENKSVIAVADVSSDIGMSIANLLLEKNFKVIGLYSKQENPPALQGAILKAVDFENEKDVISVCGSIVDTLSGLVITELGNCDTENFELGLQKYFFIPNILIRELIEKMDYFASVVLLSSAGNNAAQVFKRELVSSLSSHYSERYGIRINCIMTNIPSCLNDVQYRRLGMLEEVSEDIYLFLTAHKFATGQTFVVDGGALKVDDLTMTKSLPTAQFYKYIEKFFTSKFTKKIRSVSMMMPNEWSEDRNEKRFREYNIEAMQRGIDFKRVFIFDINDLPELKKKKLLLDYIRKTLPWTYFVDINALDNNQKILNIIKSGYLLFDDEIAIVDNETDSVGSGYITLDKNQIADYKFAMDYLEGVAVSMKEIINKKQEV